MFIQKNKQVNKGVQIYVTVPNHDSLFLDSDSTPVKKTLSAVLRFFNDNTENPRKILYKYVLPTPVFFMSSNM